MPITIDPDYRKYECLLREGRISLEGVQCPRRGMPLSGYGGEGLVLSRSVVTRGLVLLEPDGFDVLQTVRVQAHIALARCRGCKGRFRVLPSNVLARKTYSIEVIEYELAAYDDGLRSLRDVAWSILGDRSPAHTTLHAWSEGLGAHALGLPSGEVPGGAPVSRLFAESKSRARGIEALLTHDFPVDFSRARSPERRERLSATRRILALAEALTGLFAPRAFARWRQLALRWSNTCALLFRTGLACTAIEHRARPGGRGSRHPPTRSPDP